MERARVAVEVRKSWMVAGAGLVSLCALLGWAWHDGGARPLRALAVPAMLPQVGR